MMEITYAIRQWKAKKLEFITLILCLSIMVALFAATATIQPWLDDTSPSWLSKKHAYATILLEKLDSTTALASTKQLREIEGSNGITALYRIGFEDIDVDLNGNNTQLRAVFIDPKLLPLLNIPSLPSTPEAFNQGVWLSSARYHPSEGAERSSTSFVMTGSKRHFPVMGYLPESFQIPDLGPVDVLLSTEHYLSSMTVDFGDQPPPAQFLDKVFASLADNSPMFAGIAVLAEGYESDDLALEGQGRDVGTQSNVTTLSTAQSLQLKGYDGINFAPAKRIRIINQWTLMLWVSGVFAVVSFVSLVTHAINIYFRREHELTLRRAVGANNYRLLYLVQLTNIPLCVVVTIVSAILYLLVIDYLNVNQPNAIIEVTQAALGWAWSRATVFMVLLVFICTLVPSLLLLDTRLFLRDQIGSQSRLQVAVWWITTSVQSTVGFAACLLSIALLYSQYAIYNQHTFEEGNSEWALTLAKHQGEINVENVLSAVEGEPVGVALSPFVLNHSYSTPIRLEAAKESRHIPINVINVSDGYLDVLGAVWIAGAPDLKSGVIVNRTFLNVFDVSASQLLGHRIYSSQTAFGLKENQPIRIVGVIEDISPIGPLWQTSPAIYLPIVSDFRQTAGPVYIVAKHSADLSVQLTAIQNASVLATLQDRGTLSSQQVEANAEGLLLVRSGFYLALIVLVTVLINLFNMSVTYFTLFELRFGIQMALGWTKRRILLHIVKRAATIFLVSVVGGVSVCYALYESINRQFSLEIREPWIVLVAMAVFAVVSGVSAIWPSIQWLRRSIRTMLNT
ncbi:FtsX-like permease family protein [Vibrio profundi]|uniref:FtsX-like permease family protein n=1 Tax=Vibrio profundi TaxID=1774960 RepID=UPI00373556D1